MRATIDDNDWIYYDDNYIGAPPDRSKIFKLDRITSSNPNPADRHKLLGLYLDEHLSFDYHVITVCNKIAKANFIISKAKNLLLLNSLKTLYSVFPTGRNFGRKTQKWPHKNMSSRENPRPNIRQICLKMDSAT
jgi:hypothetical protein